MSRALQTAALCLSATIWHLWRIALARPVYGTLGNNQRAENMILIMFLGAGLLRHLVLGRQDPSLGSFLSALGTLLVWAILAFVLVQGVLSAVVRFAPDRQTKKDILDIATLSAFGCSAVVDLGVCLWSYATGTPPYDFWLAPFVIEVVLIVLNVRSIVRQAHHKVLKERLTCAQNATEVFTDWRRKLRQKKQAKHFYRGR
ncbi:hypothetical protein LMG26857_03438 [Achromobacter anxifer]|nr:hypothetical protein LMG26857_03438 [Achromobacter anxifer]